MQNAPIMNGWWCHIRSQALIGESAFSTDTDRLLVRGQRAEIANWKKDSFPESLLSSTLKIASSTELMAANEETSAQLKVPGTSLVPSPWFLCLMSSTFLAEHLVVAPWEKAFQPFPRRQSRQTPQEVTFGAPEPSRIWENLGSPRSMILYKDPRSGFSLTLCPTTPDWGGLKDPRAEHPKSSQWS